MKKSISAVTVVLLLVAIVIGIMINRSCNRMQDTNRKTIVSNQGEILVDTRYPGESVTFRIYYKNTTKQKCDVVIVDTIDVLLTNVSASGNGVFNSANRTLLWEIKDVPPGGAGSVEFDAEINSSATMDQGPVTNKAIIYFYSPGQDIGKKISELPVEKAKKPLPFKSKRKVITNLVRVNICSFPELGWIPLSKDATLSDQPKRVLKEETTTNIMVYFEIPGIFIQEVTLEGTLYHKITVPELSQLNDLGKPELPVIGKGIEVPADMSYDLEVFKADSVSFSCYNVMPAQLPEPEKTYIEYGQFVIDSNVYQSDRYYPEKPAFVRINDDVRVRGHRLIFLKVSPVRFNPVSKELVVYKSIEIRVKYKNPAQTEALDKRLLSPVFEDMIGSAIENFKEYERFEQDEADPGDYKLGCDYLVITPAAFYKPDNADDPIMRLCEWKHQKGLKTTVATIENIGNSAANIRNYLQNAYDTWSPVPTYVVLVGDANHITPDYRTDHGSHRVNVGLPGEHVTQVGTDLYYSTLDGGDYFPDLLLSRISVDDDADVENVVDKILDYEKNPPALANFYTNTSLVRLFEDDTDPVAPGDPPDACPADGQEDCSWILIELAEQMRDSLINWGYNAGRIYNFSGNFAQGPQRWENGTNLPDHLTQQPPTVFQWNGNTNDIVNAFNNGNFLITYRGHGGRGGWGHPGFHTGDFGLLNQNDLTPAIVCPTCQAGWFDDETDDPALGTNTDCFAEELLRLDSCGAIGLIASARNSWGAYNNPILRGCCDALWPDFDPDVSGGYLPRFGQMFVYSKIFMATTVGADDGRLITFEMTHLFGDPELAIWTAAPGELNVDHPKGIGSTGSQGFVIRVTDRATGNPVQNAVVALTRKNAILGTVQTDLNGDAIFRLDNPGSGDIVLTVTSLKYRPYQDKIEVLSGGAVINILNPDNSIAGQEIYIGAQNFTGNEEVDIFFDDQKVKTVTANSGNFGQANDITFDIPGGAATGPANIIAVGKTSGKFAVSLMKVRTVNEVELFLYSQWDQSTWNLNPGDNPIWNNPDIWLEDSGGGQVESNNLTVGDTYTIKIRIHNSSNNPANAARVTLKWAEFGVGQQVWTDIGTSAPIDVNGPGTETAEIPGWSPSKTGHICLLAQVYHIEDVMDQNNTGQENCHVGPTSSPAEIDFLVCNPTDHPAMVFLELRQIGVENLEQGMPEVIWGAEIRQPEPQLLEPGECRNAKVIIDPDKAGGKVPRGQKAKFALTAFIEGEMIGGVNFEIVKK